MRRRWWCRLRQSISRSLRAAAVRRGVRLNTDTTGYAPAWLWFQDVEELSSTLRDWLLGVRRLGWGSRFRLLICVAGSGVIFEDRFFSFLQEQDFNGSMVAFWLCTCIFHSFLLGCVRSTNLRFILQICRDEHLGIDANTSQFVSHFACHGQFRSLMRM